MDNTLYNMRPNYIGLSQLVSTVQKTHDTKKFNIIEIGAYTGQSTIFFSKYFNQIITIDPFINDYDPLDPACKLMPLESVYDIFIANTNKYDNIKHIRKKSDDAINDMNSLTDILVVYIDGLHTFDQVKKDILNYKDIIVPGGYLCGHDYHTTWSGVMDAVNSFKKPDAIFSDSSWLIKM